MIISPSTVVAHIDPHVATIRAIWLVYYRPSVYAEVRLMALDIKGAFKSFWWKGLLAHLWSIGFHDQVYILFESC